ncbi:hypothetical protein AZE42_06195 [Rhizopogon vesiculosus]|uniref:Uncharacterized protein n=1 Tax=Rhizopogon vesiculosus TaxID=180088 RepID=A0A1J8PN14_9AGAM|nr:hypothetical protein AZE42_06195 [Rhizopogon vesiculosus]
MDSNALSFYSNVFGLLIGGTTILGVFLGFCRSHLPSQRIKELEELFEETQGLYESAVEDGLLHDMAKDQTRERLAVLHERTLQLRSRAYSATTLLKDYQKFLRGLSYSIGVACYDVKELRASIITTTEAERRRTGVCRDDYSAVQRPSSPVPPQISCAMEMRSIARPQSDLPDAGCTMTQADAPHAPCGLHVIEVDLTELGDSVPAAFLGRRFSLDTASTFSDDRSDDNPTMGFKQLLGEQEDVARLQCPT